MDDDDVAKGAKVRHSHVVEYADEEPAQHGKVKAAFDIDSEMVD